MYLWRKAAGALKDRNSIWFATLSHRGSTLNLELERAMIKATSHDQQFLDYKNTQRVFAWIRTTPLCVQPLFLSLGRRMRRTRCWVVALKGLILLHGVFCCRVPAVQKIGRLPFDLSNFRDDGHKKLPGLNPFVRSYFAFLDQKSVSLCVESQSKKAEASLAQDIENLKRWQASLNLLLQVRASDLSMRVNLVLEAMDCVLLEIYDVYSKICRGIARLLMRIYTAEKNDAAMALKVLRKAKEQNEELEEYFEFCRLFGVFNASSELPKVEHIPEEDLDDIERIVNGDLSDEEEKAMAVKDVASDELYKESSKTLFRTIITDKWEVFDDDLSIVSGGNDLSQENVLLLEHKTQAPNAVSMDVPDLITL